MIIKDPGGFYIYTGLLTSHTREPFSKLNFIMLNHDDVDKYNGRQRLTEDI